MSSDGKLTQGLFLCRALCYDIFMSNYNNDRNQNYNDPFTQSPGPGPGNPGPGPGPYNQRGRKSSGSSGLDEFISWAIGVCMLFAFPPLGVILTIAHALGHNILGGIVSQMTGSQRSARSGSSRSSSSSSRRSTGSSASRRPDPYAQQRRAQTARTAPAEEAQDPEDAAREKALQKVDAGAKALTIVGWVLFALGIVLMLNAAGLWSFITTLAVSLGGVSMLAAAGLSRRQARKFRRCLTITGDEGVVELARVKATLGLDDKAFDKLLTEMVDRGYYGPKAYIDHQRQLLVIDVEDMRDVYRREDEAKKTQAQRDQEARMSEYERIIADIRQADEDIEDEVMSEKIRRMQSSTAAIFREVEAHPEKKSQIERFMNYYLPTTLKLLDSYARIERQGVSGENMAKAKADIERIADTLVAGYEKQLDTLYTADAMDIAGDVSVIENMMRRDGLSGGTDFRTQAQGGTTAGGV